jgi:hypothetical protein
MRIFATLDLARELGTDVPCGRKRCAAALEFNKRARVGARNSACSALASTTYVWSTPSLAAVDQERDTTTLPDRLNETLGAVYGFERELGGGGMSRGSDLEFGRSRASSQMMRGRRHVGCLVRKAPCKGIK